MVSLWTVKEFYLVCCLRTNTAKWNSRPIPGDNSLNLGCEDNNASVREQ